MGNFGDFQNGVYADAVRGVNTRYPFDFPSISVQRAIAVIAERILAAVTVIRGVHDDVDEQDPTSADLLHVVIEGLEKQRWMLVAELRHVSN